MMNPDTKRRLINAAVFVIPAGLVTAVVAIYFVLESPRMYRQPNFRTFNSIFPPPPAVSKPQLESGFDLRQIPSPNSKNPIASTTENIAKGKTYYSYYCIFCHGEKGDGEGPVGMSYTPVPADLRQDKIAKLDDAALYKAMLTGIGHEPVLEKVVLPAHRWYVVMYIRELGIKQ